VLAVLAGALAAGLLATPHCVGMCGGFATACARRSPAGALPWHVGRLATYATLGAVAGAVGHLLPGPGWIASALAAALLLWFAASIAGLVREPRLVIPGVAALAHRAAAERGTAWRVAFGAATGLLPCGMVYAALSVSVALAHPLAGATAMLAFGLGTVPGLALLATALQRLAARGLWQRRALAALVLAAGLWSIGTRQMRAGRMHGAHGGAGMHMPAGH
jgi:sulfite exporter TauE/SafE